MSSKYCRVCGSTGKITRYEKTSNDCKSCGGTGRNPFIGKCKACFGTGKEQLEITENCQVCNQNGQRDD